MKISINWQETLHEFPKNSDILLFYIIFPYLNFRQEYNPEYSRDVKSTTHDQIINCIIKAIMIMTSILYLYRKMEGKHRISHHCFEAGKKSCFLLVGMCFLLVHSNLVYTDACFWEPHRGNFLSTLYLSIYL